MNELGLIMAGGDPEMWSPVNLSLLEDGEPPFASLYDKIVLALAGESHQFKVEFSPIESDAVSHSIEFFQYGGEYHFKVFNEQATERQLLFSLKAADLNGVPLEYIRKAMRYFLDIDSISELEIADYIPIHAAIGYPTLAVIDSETLAWLAPSPSPERLYRRVRDKLTGFKYWKLEPKPEHITIVPVFLRAGFGIIEVNPLSINVQGFVRTTQYYHLSVTIEVSLKDGQLSDSAYLSRHNILTAQAANMNVGVMQSVLFRLGWPTDDIEINDTFEAEFTVNKAIITYDVNAAYNGECLIWWV